MKKLIFFLFFISTFNASIFVMEEAEKRRTIEQLPSMAGLETGPKVGTNFVQMCLENEIGSNHRQRRKDSKSSDNKTASIFSLPIELIIHIGDWLLNGNKNKKAAVRDYLNFAQVIKGDKCFEGQDIRNLRALTVLLGDAINPFALARRLKIVLSRQEKEHYKNLAIKKELEKKRVAPEKLNQWLAERSDKDYDNLFAVRFIEQLPIWFGLTELIELLALLTLVDPNTEIDETGTTALMKAARTWHAEYVDILLAVGADPNYKNGKGRTALMQMCDSEGTPPGSFDLSCKEKIVEKLFNYGADPNIQNKLGNTALIFAAAHGNKEKIIDVLLKFGADPNIQNSRGTTALMWAVSLYNSKVVSKLLIAGADPNLKDKSWNTALSILFYMYKQYKKIYKNRENYISLAKLEFNLISELLKKYGARSTLKSFINSNF